MNQGKATLFKSLIFPFLLLFGGLSAAISMNHFDHRAIAVHADTITNLNGYTWVGKETPNFTQTTSKTYSLNFSSNNKAYKSFKINNNGAGHNLYYDEDRASDYSWNTSQFYWVNEAYKTIVFDATDAGTDKADGTLIAWLDANGTLTAPSGGDVAVTGVTLDITEDTLSVGGSVQLTATVAPDNATNKNVTWSSNNESVATVSNSGLVTAVAAGSATITVTTENGNHAATCAITVSAVAVTGVELDKDAAEVNVGSTVTLTPTVSPSDATNKNVIWSTSNSGVATVADGVVTGVAEGSATITVTTVNGSFTDTCAITVSASSGEGLYTTIIVKDTINWNFKSLWLDNFSYANGYNQTMRNAFFDESTFYGDIIDNWTTEYKNGKKGHYYYGTGVNLSCGTNSTNTFYIPAWITDFTIEVQDDNSNNNTYLDFLSDLYSYNSPWIAAGPKIHESGLGKTIEIDMNSTSHGSLSGDVTLKNIQNYSNTVTVNTYYLKSDGPVKTSRSVERHQFYLPNVNKVAVDGYATNNKWYSGTTYDASDEFNSILTDSTTNLVSKYEVGSNDSTIELRFTRKSDWGDHTVRIHTWNDGGSGTTFPGYAMTYLWDGATSGDTIWSWSPSFDEPLYGAFKFNNDNYGMETSALTSPSKSTNYWYDNGWQSGDIEQEVIYLLDYANVYGGNVDVSLSRYGTSFADEVKAVQMIDVATNGLMYKVTFSNRYNRIVFSNNGADKTDYLIPPQTNYVYVLGGGVNDWWDNINYALAYNFAMRTMLMDKIPTSDHSVTPYCAERYNDAKTHFNALMASGYGTSVLNELNNSFANAMERFAAWASANGEGIDNTNGNIYTNDNIYTNNTILLSVDTNITILILVVVSIPTLVAGGFFLLRRRQR